MMGFLDRLVAPFELGNVKVRAAQVVEKHQHIKESLKRFRILEAEVADSVLSLHKQSLFEYNLQPLKLINISKLEECTQYLGQLSLKGINTAYDILAAGSEGKIVPGVTVTDTKLHQSAGISPNAAKAAMLALQRVNSELKSLKRISIDPDKLSSVERTLIEAVALHINLRDELPAVLDRMRTQAERIDTGLTWIKTEMESPSLRFDRPRQRQLADYCDAIEPHVEQFDNECQKEIRQLKRLPSEGPMEPVRRYSENNAWFYAALDAFLPSAPPVAATLAREQNVDEAPKPSSTPTTPAKSIYTPWSQPGQVKSPNTLPVQPAVPPSVGDPTYGQVPKTIAQQVEATVLQRGPLKASLRRYQQFGAQYIISQKRTLLGDDMGLGKTVQALAAMCHLHATGKRHFLVVVPAGVLINWQREIALHTSLESFVFHGLTYFKDCRAWAEKGGVGLTTYGSLGNLSFLVSELPKIDMMVVDEAHMVKNPKTKRTKNVINISMRSSYVTFMSGTALENRLSELRRLILLVQPDLYESMQYLITNGWPSPVEVRRRVAPVYLRRTKDDVLHELPEMTLVDEYVELTDVEVRSSLNMSDIQNRRIAASVGDRSGKSSKYSHFEALLETYRENGEKVVIFSAFRKVLEDVSAMCSCERITGDIAPAERMRIIDRFKEKTGFACLALQVDAGGLGINLQFARVVVLMEPQFKPSTESQAIARVHRMGQGRKVIAHRLIAKDTIDEDLVLLVSSKKAIFDAYAHNSAVKEASAMSVDASSVQKDIAKELEARAIERRNRLDSSANPQ